MNSERNMLSEMVESQLVAVEPATHQLNLSDSSKYIRIDTDSNIDVSGLFSQVPAVASSAAMSGMYYLTFPEGVVGALTKLKQRGLSTALKGVNGQFVGSASLHQALAPATVFGAFTAMALVSGQYFLKKINAEMKLINQKIDKVLSFLYGDKKAELLSEISFVQRAMRDYTSIMENDNQRTATISGIQASGKVAMKDIEFYIQDLKSIVETVLSEKDVTQTVQSVMQICDSLNAALQLYIMSCVLEIYYSQNTNRDFIDNLKSDVAVYIEKCHGRMLSDVSQLKGKIESVKTRRSFDKQPCIDTLNSITESISQGKTRELLLLVDDTFDRVSREARFVITDKDELYYAVS